MTLEDLAVMVQRGFVDQGRQLREEAVASEQRLREHVSQEVGKVQTELAELRHDHGERLDRIERKLDATVTVNDQLDRRVSRIEKHAGLPPLEPALK